jgi:predicted Zn-dependent peptidase
MQPTQSPAKVGDTTQDLEPEPAKASQSLFSGSTRQVIDLRQKENLMLMIGENALPVIFVPIETAKGQFSMTFYSFGGLHNVPDELIEAARLWPQLRLMSGVPAYPGLAFLDFQAQYNLEIEASYAITQAEVSISGPSSSFEQASETLSALLSAPNNPNYLDQLLDVLEYRESEFLQAYLQQIYPDDRRYRQLPSGSTPVIEDLNRVQELISQQHSGIALVISGDLEQEMVKQSLEQSMFGLALAPAQNYQSRGPQAKEFELFQVKNPNKRGSEIRAVYAQQQLATDPEAYYLSQLAVAYLDSYLKDKLAPYLPSQNIMVFQRTASFAEIQWLVQVRLKIDAGEEQFFSSTLQTLLNQLANNSLDAKRLAEVRSQLIERFEAQTKEPSGLNKLLFDTLKNGADITTYNDFETAIGEVSEEDVLLFLRFFLGSNFGVYAIELGS